MGAAATVLPVIFMLILGNLFSRRKVLSQETMDGIKWLVSQIMLPVVIFNALITTSFNSRSILISLIVYISFTAILLIALAVPKVSATYRMTPFLLAGSEGGMLAYPLYITLYGASALSTLMPIDLGNILFAFTFFIVLIHLKNAEDSDRRTTIIKSLTSPLVLIVAAALILNVTGLSRFLTDSPVTPIYTAVESMIASPLTALILLSVGYDLRFNAKLMKNVLKTCGLRAILMLMVMGFLLTVGRNLIDSKELLVAVLLYFSLPPQFVTPVFVRNENERAYVATMLSCYSILTIVVYTIIATMIQL